MIERASACQVEGGGGSTHDPDHNGLAVVRCDGRTTKHQPDYGAYSSIGRVPRCERGGYGIVPRYAPHMPLKLIRIEQPRPKRQAGGSSPPSGASRGPIRVGRPGRASGEDLSTGIV
jgi:hypothetical protein